MSTAAQAEHDERVWRGDVKEARVFTALREELDESWKDFYDTSDRRRRNLLRTLKVRTF